VSGAGSQPAAARAIQDRPKGAETNRNGVANRRVSRWLLPDFALVIASVTVFYCLFVFQGYQKLFRDSDSGWHIRTGEAILSTGALPRTDPYSFTRAGHPWFAWEWGADILMGAAHGAAGLSGVALLYAAAIGAGVWCWFRLHWAVGGDFLLAAFMAAPLLATCGLHWMARPHVLSWIFMVGSVWWAERVCAGAPPRIAAVALAGALWANVHASFLFLPLLCLVYGVSHLLHPLIWGSGGRTVARRFFAAAGVAALATLANPYGWNLHRHVIAYLADHELLSRVAEFQSFNFHLAGSWQVLLALGIAAAGGVLALSSGRLARFLLAAIVLTAALRSARALPLVALLLLPLANGEITRALRCVAGLNGSVRRRFDAFLDYSARLRRLDATLNGAALAPAVLAVAFLLLRLPAVAAQTGFPPGQFPVAAMERVASLPPETRLLAPDLYGGYLIYRFKGKLPVFFDGRSDLYGTRFLKDYGRLAQVRPGWQALLDGFAFTHALLPNDYSLIPALESAGWRPIWRDGAATLLAKGANP
jgi:hypothetical protein